MYGASVLNPVYYNPSITYTPWNDNGRAGSVAPFVASDSGMNGPDAIGFREGRVAHDMRYVGPNYEFNRNPNRGRKLTTTGANPPGVDSYLIPPCTVPPCVASPRPANGGLAGAV